ncbi:hypothetical protein TNCV_4653711 [Trichonephila clavipes]|nr:hypothetical protein TNCV_4653711 [Trichonephila clavipes]
MTLCDNKEVDCDEIEDKIQAIKTADLSSESLKFATTPNSFLFFHNSGLEWQPSAISSNLWTPPELTNQQHGRQVSSSADPECSPKPDQRPEHALGMEKIASYKSFLG